MSHFDELAKEFLAQKRIAVAGVSRNKNETANGIQVIAGGCPMMFFDPFHKCMKWALSMMGRLPTA